MTAQSQPQDARSADAAGTPQPAELFERLKAYVGFGEDDAQRLRQLGPLLRPHLPAVVERFYATVAADSRTIDILTRTGTPIEVLKRALQSWLESLFAGRYDADYLRRRVRIGKVHVRVGLPEHYMIVAMEVVRQELAALIASAGVTQPREATTALHKLLSVELALMLESYHGTFVEQVRETERSAVRERLTQAEHLAQIGRLAASLAHEIKNPLAGISGAVQVIRDSMPADAPHRPILGEVLRQINRLDQTVKDLLVYSRPVPPRFEPCDLRGVFERLGALLAREPAMQRVRLECSHDGQRLPEIEADSNQIEQLLMNLILNAAHASEDGSVVKVAARAVAGGVRLIVADRGHGMDPETQRRAFEPFFTTKARGTGLGLPICRRIVEAHGGRLSIRSAPGQGTTVEIELPLHQREPERNWHEHSGADS